MLRLGLFLSLSFWEKYFLESGIPTIAKFELSRLIVFVLIELSKHKVNKLKVADEIAVPTLIKVHIFSEFLKRGMILLLIHETDS